MDKRIGLGFQPSTITLTDIPSGINANQIANGSVSNTEFQYIDGVTSGIQSQLNNKQPLASILTALTVASTGGWSDGFIHQSGGVVSTGFISSSAPISISNGSGPVVEVGLSSNGILDTHVASGLSAAKIADGSVSNTEFQYLNNASSNIQAQLDAKKRALVIPLCMGFTPSASGADTVQFPIPYSPADGTSSITWNLRRLQIRATTPSSGTTSVMLEKSTASGAFSATSMMASALSLSGSGTYEAHTETFSVGTIASGDKLRFNATALDGTHAGFTITVLLEAST